MTWLSSEQSFFRPESHGAIYKKHCLFCQYMQYLRQNFKHSFFFFVLPEGFHFKGGQNQHDINSMNCGTWLLDCAFVHVLIKAGGAESTDWRNLGVRMWNGTHVQPQIREWSFVTGEVGGQELSLERALSQKCILNTLQIPAFTFFTHSLYHLGFLVASNRNELSLF